MGQQRQQDGVRRTRVAPALSSTKLANLADRCRVRQSVHRQE
jgi:hypothetical protein